MGRFSRTSLVLHAVFSFFFFNDTATTEIYTLSLHDALPISTRRIRADSVWTIHRAAVDACRGAAPRQSALRREPIRSEEHTSELQSQSNLVCRLLLEKKKQKKKILNDVRRLHYNNSTQLRVR